MNLKLSRYSFLFNREGKYLLYNSRRNNFYELNRELYSYLSDTDIFSADSASAEQAEMIEQLRSLNILATEENDDDYLAELRLRHNIRAFDSSALGLTIVPTISCNLRCPYCFEENKPAGMMTRETADKLISFISEHEAAKDIDITWFGGEPTLGVDIMEYILEKVQDIDGKKLCGHSIITNGTLWTDRVIALFKKYPLGGIQITLDGMQPEHDRKRIRHDGSGTFEDIMNNIGRITDALPDVKLDIRINVDNTNSADYIRLSDMLYSRFPEAKNISIYPGILRANRGCESPSFFTSADVVRFYDMLRQHGHESYGYPQHCSKGCMATRTSSYVVGPRGELYKCWEHLGKPELEIGKIDSPDLTNGKLMRRLIDNGHLFSSAECRRCGLLPVCSGGCPNKRYENLYCGANHDICTVYHSSNDAALHDLLYNYFASSKKKLKNLHVSVNKNAHVSSLI